MQHPGNSHFLMALGRHDAGGVVDTADEALREVIRAVLNTGKSGNVTIKMVVAKNGDKGLEVSCEVAAKAPRLAFGKAFYFTNGNDDLVRDAPRLNLEPTGPVVHRGGRDD